MCWSPILLKQVLKCFAELGPWSLMTASMETQNTAVWHYFSTCWKEDLLGKAVSDVTLPFLFLQVSQETMGRIHPRYNFTKPLEIWQGKLFPVLFSASCCVCVWGWWECSGSSAECGEVFIWGNLRRSLLVRSFRWLIFSIGWVWYCLLWLDYRTAC